MFQATDHREARRRWQPTAEYLSEQSWSASVKRHSDRPLVRLVAVSGVRVAQQLLVLHSSVKSPVGLPRYLEKAL